MKNPGLYILTSPSGKQYVGKDSNLPSRATQHLHGRPQCPAIHDAIQKYGRNVFSVEIIRYPGISHEALNAVERWWIRRLQTLSPSGYNLTEGGDGVVPSEETRQKMRENAVKRVEDGTHNFLDGEVARHTNKKRLEDGTHIFLDDEIQQHAKKKRDATNKKRLKDGTHNFLNDDFQRQVQKKRVANGTHHFLSGEISRRTHKKRLDEGTHHFLGDSNPAKRLSKEGRHPQTIKRLKGQWCYIIAVSRFYYEIHDYTLKRRKDFLSKDIPDLSNAEQTYLF
ncbi:hypothetical protein C6502_12730 [Candidatus Poribacteria bacterium]|nr:MAG: hypothetical protein C6502_12730 [Candidatus Poribacteria bacterium]